MNHKEMSRRAPAIGLVWGFWLFWVIAGAACLTTHEIEHHSIVLGYDGRYPEPEYTSAGLIVAACVWLIASVFPMLLEQWKYGKVSCRCVAEFAIAVLISIVAGGAAEGGDQDTIYLACFVVMVALSYSCFRLRQAGLDYLEPLLLEVDESSTEKADTPLQTTELPWEGQQRAKMKTPLQTRRSRQIRRKNDLVPRSCVEYCWR